jgi:rhodanese-related sulfurtransferase
MEAIVELNRGPFLAAQAPLARLDIVPDDAIVLDVRDAHAFAAGHLPGAVNVPVSGSSFGTRSAFVLPDLATVIDATGQDDAQLAAQRLWAVGLLDVLGWREGGGSEQVEPVTIDELERRLAADEILVYDVREADERDAGFIPGSCHLPYRNARQAAENGLLGERPIVTICESGPRAAIAARVPTPQVSTRGQYSTAASTSGAHAAARRRRSAAAAGRN